MVLALHCYCRNNIKHGFLPKHLFQNKNMSVEKSQSNNKLLEKIISSRYHID